MNLSANHLTSAMKDIKIIVAEFTIQTGKRL